MSKQKDSGLVQTALWLKPRHRKALMDKAREIAREERSKTTMSEVGRRLIDGHIGEL